MSEYVLGTSAHELDRLRLQHEIWGPVTERFLDRLHLREGARVLDAGCGPGYVVEMLRARVEHSGRVVALDESPKWMEHLAATCGRRGWRNVQLLQTRLEQAQLEPNSFDLVFARWVLSFVPEPRAVFEKLARALKPGGVIAIEDYNHEGISLFPESAGFRALVRATRALYASRGGDPWIAGRLGGFARACGLETLELHPNVLCGGPDAPAFRWADAFFPYHSSGMVEAGVLSAAEREQFLREWDEHKRDPDALFCSPIVFDFAARKPARG